MAEAPLQLPGYQIDHLVARGGMGELYLATGRRSSERVAIKRMRPELLTGSADSAARFAGECRMNARLSHPNIVRTVEVITEGKELALVTEYLAGGSLFERLKAGMHVSLAIAAVSDIARALDHAHGLGIVHGDVKPENILFRDPATAVLIDFGLARLVSRTASQQRPDGGPAVNTPLFGSAPYMSPELLAGQVVDGRTDLYSLGVVLYQVLTGDVPYRGDDPAEIALRQLQEPVPRLPLHFAVFQPVVDRLLARRPELRFSSGNEIADTLETIRLEGAMPAVTIRTGEVTSGEIRAVAASVLVTLKDPRRAVERGQRRRRQRVLAVSITAAVGLLAVSAGSYWLATHPERLVGLLADAGLMEKPGLDDALSEARSLRQDPNQGLRALVAAYERVLMIDPQHAGAREEIAGLADEWKSATRAALSAGNFSAAEARLNEARQAFADDAGFTALSLELEDRRNAEALLASTQALLRSHGVADIPSATAAIQAFNEVLRLAPGHMTATAELNAIAEHYAVQAAERVRAGDMQAAIGHLDRAGTANPSLPQIASIRASIQQANTTLGTITQLLEQARLFRESGELVTPPGDNAAALYHQVLSIEPGNTIARQGLDEVVARLRETVARRLKSGDFAAVADIITQASAVNLNAVAVEEFRGQLVAEQTRVANLNRLLADARKYLADGYLTAPEQGNATQSLREVQRLDPGNVDAVRMLRAVAQRLAEVAVEARAAGLNREAQEYLDLALAIVPGVPEWQTLRETWADTTSAGRRTDARNGR